jgi:hypothetical protein
MSSNISDVTNKLINIEYPLKDHNGEVIATRKIVDAYMIENMTGVAIMLENNFKSCIVISLREAFNLNSQKEFK